MKVIMSNFNILSIVLVLIYLGNSQGNNSLIIQNISKFPIQLGDPFEITVSAGEKSKLSNSKFGTMVIQVTDPTGSAKEKAVYEFGEKEVSDQDFNGTYFSIVIWGTNKEHRIIFSVMNFTKLAHNQNLQIYILDPTSTKERNTMLSDLKQAKYIYKSKISLLIPSEIELKINSKAGNEVSVVKDSIVEATCQAINGLPKLKPNFVNYWAFNVSSNFSNEDLNILHIKFKVSLADHGKNLTCQMGNETKIVKINVFHSPTNIVIHPEINETVGNNTDIICSTFNGYPTPRITWKYIEGPPNSTEYYEINPSIQKLLIKENAPIGSNWKFICSANNIILENSETFNKTISFRITNQRRNFLSQIDELYRKLNNLEENVYSRDLNSSLLKDISYKQRLQLFRLKKEVDKLNDKQRETNEEIISIKKIVSSEIKNLKKEISKFIDILPKKNGQNSAEESKSIKNEPIIMPIATYDWKIFRVSYLRRKRKTLFGSKLRNRNTRFSMMLLLHFNDIEYFRITVHMSNINNADSSLLIKGYVTITLINPLNLAEKRLKQYFQRGRQAANVHFNFRYIDLYQNQILQSDNIIIRCSLIIL